MENKDKNLLIRPCRNLSKYPNWVIEQESDDDEYSSFMNKDYNTIQKDVEKDRSDTNDSFVLMLPEQDDETRFTIQTASILKRQTDKENENRTSIKSSNVDHTDFQSTLFMKLIDSPKKTESKRREFSEKVIKQTMVGHVKDNKTSGNFQVPQTYHSEKVESLYRRKYKIQMRICKSDYYRHHEKSAKNIQNRIRNFLQKNSFYINNIDEMNLIMKRGEKLYRDKLTDKIAILQKHQSTHTPTKSFKTRKSLPQKLNISTTDMDDVVVQRNLGTEIQKHIKTLRHIAENVDRLNHSTINKWGKIEYETSSSTSSVESIEDSSTVSTKQSSEFRLIPNLQSFNTKHALPNTTSIDINFDSSMNETFNKKSTLVKRFMSTIFTLFKK